MQLRIIIELASSTTIVLLHVLCVCIVWVSCVCVLCVCVCLCVCVIVRVCVCVCGSQVSRGAYKLKEDSNGPRQI